MNMPLLILGMIGTWQLVAIVALIVVLFGGKKIPDLMKGVGRGIKEFKDAVNKDYTNPEAPKNETTAPSATTEKNPADETTRQA